MLQRNVVDFMRKRLGLADTYTEEEIHRAVGILRCVTIQLYSGSKMPPMSQDERVPSGAPVPGSPGHLGQGDLPHLLLPLALLRL